MSKLPEKSCVGGEAVDHGLGSTEGGQTASALFFWKRQGSLCELLETAGGLTAGSVSLVEVDDLLMLPDLTFEVQA